MGLKYVVASGTNPYSNLAVEAELMSHVVPGMAILYLWQNENTIVIGRNQNLSIECNVEEFMRDGGSIARRRSGGGAVFHDLGNLNFSIICEKQEQQKYAYQKVISMALMRYGIQSEFNGRNDLVWQGRKFSGNATYDDGSVLCQHGTIMVSTDIEKMTRFLTPDKSKLERNHVSSVASRVVNLQDASDAISVEGLKKTIIESSQAERFEYRSDEKRYEDFLNFFTSEKWIYGGDR